MEHFFNAASADHTVDTPEVNLSTRMTRRIYFRANPWFMDVKGTVAVLTKDGKAGVVRLSSIELEGEFDGVVSTAILLHRLLKKVEAIIPEGASLFNMLEVVEEANRTDVDLGKDAWIHYALPIYLVKDIEEVREGVRDGGLQVTEIGPYEDMYLF